MNSEDLVQEANNLLFRITLRLDPKKDLSKELILLMRTLVSLCTYAKEMSTVVDQSALDVIKKTQAIPDEEWIKVRKGEGRFRNTFFFAPTALIGSLAILFIQWLKNGDHL